MWPCCTWGLMPEPFAMVLLLDDWDFSPVWGCFWWRGHACVKWQWLGIADLVPSILFPVLFAMALL
jgi:hypothetical protein